jgi:signal transduction histidine kinase
MRWVVPVARRWPEDWSARVIDVTVALFSTAAAVALHSEVVAARGQRELLTPALAVAMTYGSAVLFRRKSPLWVLAAMLVCAWLYVLMGLPAYMLGPGLVFAMYSGGAGLPRGPSSAALAVVEVNVIVLLLVGPSFPGLGSIVLYGGILASSWALGDLLRRWRTAAAEHARRADELAATREELAHYAVVEERRRIARELHDVVAHAMTVVAMHAGTGRLAATTDPTAATFSLHTIEKVSREALSEMRRLVTLLRDDSDEESYLSPTPSLGDLHRLVGEMVGAGMVIDVRADGPIDRISAGLSAVAFRTIQEALTNAARHAGPVRARLEVIATEKELAVTVENDPPASEVVSRVGDGGAGLLGMRERVQIYDGSLVTESQPNGGFRVEAHFPLESSR